MGGRLYDPRIGRVLQADPPFMESPFWSQGLNRYSYVFNNPLNLTAPSGFMAEHEHPEDDDVTVTVTESQDPDTGIPVYSQPDIAEENDPNAGPGEIDVGSLNDNADDEAGTSPGQGPHDDSPIGDSGKPEQRVRTLPRLPSWDPSATSSPQVQPHATAPSAHLPHPTTASEWGWHVYTTLMILVFNPGVANTPRPGEATYNHTAEQMTGHPGTLMSQWSHTGALNATALHKAISHYLPSTVNGQKATYSAAQIQGGLQHAYADVRSSDLFGAIEHLIP